MKVSKRVVPQDILAFEHKSYRVYVGTNRNVLDIRIHKDGQVVHWQSMTPEQFVSLLMRDAKP